MPSIPQSLLWISLVVLWLFVLVPMLISKRDAVRRTSDVALATRVLNSGAGARLRRRRGPASGHRSDPDWQSSAEEADLDDEAAPSRAVVMVAAEADGADGEPDYLDVDVVEDSGALPVADIAEPVAAETDELTLDFDGVTERDDVRDEPVTAAAQDGERDTSEDTAVYSVIDDEYEYDGDTDDEKRDDQRHDHHLQRMEPRRAERPRHRQHPAAAPQMLLPAPISIAVWLSMPNTFLPSQQASRKVVIRVSASMMMPLAPTSAIC